MIKILQVNMHRGRVADSLLPQIATEEAATIVIISEQHSKRKDGKWFEDFSGTAAIWIPNGINLKTLGTGAGDGFVWVKLDGCTIISCYLTPSDNMEEFQNKINAIEDEISHTGERYIVAGDFNSRAIEWGSQLTNTRGRRILEMAARSGLSVANVGSTPTFRRPGCEGTIPDITLVSETLASKISNWKVLEIYTGSDHQYISYSLSASGREFKQAGKGTRKWNTKSLDETALVTEIDRHEYRANNDAVSVVEHTMNTIIKACNKAMPKIKSTIRGRQAVYWWNDSIAELRRTCLSLRRAYTRTRRRGPAEREREAYKEAQKNLRNAINKSKKDKWEELRDDINRDPWGLGYKIVMKKLGSKNPVEIMDAETMDNIVGSLFPTHDTRPADPDDVEASSPPLFTLEELNNAVGKLKLKKAPGLDGIPVEVLREIADKRPGILLYMYNCCLSEGVFPEIWKEQKLVLISKGKGDPSGR